MKDGKTCHIQLHFLQNGASKIILVQHWWRRKMDDVFTGRNKGERRMSSSPFSCLPGCHSWSFHLSSECLIKGTGGVGRVCAKISNDTKYRTSLVTLNPLDYKCFMLNKQLQKLGLSKSISRNWSPWTKRLNQHSVQRIRPPRLKDGKWRYFFKSFRLKSYI